MSDIITPVNLICSPAAAPTPPPSSQHSFPVKQKDASQVIYMMPLEIKLNWIPASQISNSKASWAGMVVFKIGPSVRNNRKENMKEKEIAASSLEWQVASSSNKHPWRRWLILCVCVCGEEKGRERQIYCLLCVCQRGRWRLGLFLVQSVFSWKLRHSISVHEYSQGNFLLLLFLFHGFHAWCLSICVCARPCLSICVCSCLSICVCVCLWHCCLFLRLSAFWCWLTGLVWSPETIILTSWNHRPGIMFQTH